MNKTTGQFWVLLALIGWMGRPTAAQDYGPDRLQDRQETRDKVALALNLTTDQRDKLETHRIDQRAEMEKCALVVKEKIRRLKAALEDPTAHTATLRQIHGELKDAQNEEEDQRLEGLLYLREVLTPEQFKKFLTLSKPQKLPKPDHGFRGRERLPKKSGGSLPKKNTDDSEDLGEEGREVSRNP